MINSVLQQIIQLSDSLKSNYQGIIEFYNMNWYGLEIGHYMSWIGLVGLALVILQAYLKSHRNKNDIRRFLVDEQHRKPMV